jgi:hypothetical protein
LPALANGGDSTVEIIVNRREFLDQSIVLAFGLSLAEWGSVTGILTDAQHVDAVALTDLRTATRLHMRQWCTAVPTDLLPQAMARVRLMKGWLDRPHAAAVIHRDLQLAVAEAAINAGWLSNLADNLGDARTLWMLAEQLATDAGDGPLLAIALAGRSCLHSPVDRGGCGVSLTVELLDAALKAAGSGASVQSRAYLHARRAEELAAAGVWKRVYADLEAADRLLDSTENRDEGLFWRLDRAQLRGFRGNCEVLLYRSGASTGRPALASAVATIEAALAETAATLVPQRSAMLADLAAACGQRRDLDRAAAVLGEALDLAWQTRLEERVQRVRTIRHRELDGWGDSPAVKQFDDRLRSMG